jgi:hypothetical protein
MKIEGTTRRYTDLHSPMVIERGPQTVIYPLIAKNA